MSTALCCCVFLPIICDDLGYDEPELQGPEARAEFIKKLPLLPVFCNKGPKASTSRWMSWQAAFRWHDPYHHTKLLVSAHVALRKGWLRHAEDLWEDSAAVQLVVVDSADAGASSSSAKPPEIKRTTRPLAAVTASQKGKFLNTFAAVLKSMANPDLLLGARMLCCLTAWEEIAHAEMAMKMKSAGSTAKFFDSWAEWSWLRPLEHAIGVFKDTVKLGRMGVHRGLLWAAIP